MNADSYSEHKREQARWVQRLVLSLVAAALLVSAGFAAGVGSMWFFGPQIRQSLASVSANSGTIDADLPPEQRADLLWEIWGILDREFILPEAIDGTKMIHGAAEGMVGSVEDPYTAFVRPVPAAIMDEDMQGSFEGIGATVEMVEGQLVIVRPLPKSPAEEAGLEAGDIVLEVDGKPLEGMEILDAITLIRGPRGTVVRLLIQREDIAEPFIVPVTRDEVEVVTVESEALGGGIGYIRLREFNAIAHKRLREAAKALIESGQADTGLILDLRGNPGGYLQMAVDVASEFLPRGELILVEQQRGEAPEEYRVKRAGVALDVPLVILIDQGSASASEIVAGAIRDNARGTLIGQRTFGKGSVQNTHTLQDGSSLRVTIARWLLPGGDHLDGEGIAPDIQVEATAEQISARVDAQRERAIQFLREGK